MQIKLGLIIALFLSLLTLNHAKAGLITETWHATITSSNITGYEIDDEFSWQITFDELSMSYDLYNDGADGVARTVDDIIDYTFDANCPKGNSCLYELRDAPVVNETLTSQLNIIANAALSNSSYASFYDKYNQNINNTYTTRQQGENTYYWNRYDHIEFVAQYDPLTKTGKGQFTTYLDFEHVQLMEFQLGAITNERALVTEVPEPSTLAIFSLALLGLTSRKFKKQV